MISAAASGEFGGRTLVTIENPTPKIHTRLKKIDGRQGGEPRFGIGLELTALARG